MSTDENNENEKEEQEIEDKEYQKWKSKNSTQRTVVSTVLIGFIFLIIIAGISVWWVTRSGTTLPPMEVIIELAKIIGNIIIGILGSGS